MIAQPLDPMPMAEPGGLKVYNGAADSQRSGVGVCPVACRSVGWAGPGELEQARDRPPTGGIGLDLQTISSEKFRHLNRPFSRENSLHPPERH